MQYSAYQTFDCPENSILQETFGFVELYDYDTIWNKKLTTPNIKLGT